MCACLRVCVCVCLFVCVCVCVCVCSVCGRAGRARGPGPARDRNRKGWVHEGGGRASASARGGRSGTGGRRSRSAWTPLRPSSSTKRRARTTCSLRTRQPPRRHAVPRQLAGAVLHFVNLCGAAVQLSQDALADLYVKLSTDYPIVSIEDPFDQDDWASWQDLTRRLSPGQNGGKLDVQVGVGRAASALCVVGKRAIFIVIIILGVAGRRRRPACDEPGAHPRGPRQEGVQRAFAQGAGGWGGRS